VETDTHTASGGPEALVGLTVAVVVQTVTFFESNTFFRIADLGDTTDAILHGVEANSDPTRRAPQFLVHLAVAVVVKTVAVFYPDARPFITNLVHTVDAVVHGVEAHTEAARRGPEVFIHLAVAVVVQAIAHVDDIGDRFIDALNAGAVFGAGESAVLT